MKTITGTWTNGQILPDAAGDWPEGCRLKIEPLEPEDYVGVREEDWSNAPDDVAAWLKWYDSLEPLEFTAEEEADLAAWRISQPSAAAGTRGSAQAIRQMGGKGQPRIAMTESGLTRASFESIVEAGILAPSADNRHPFLFDYVGATLRIWGNDEFRSAPFHRRVLLLLSLGAVGENIRLRAESLGLEARVDWFPDLAEPSLAATLNLTRKPAVAGELAGAIPHRHTNRRFFHGPRMSQAELEQLESDAAMPGTRLIWLDEPGVRSKALRLVRLAEAERFTCQYLHQELFSAIRFDVFLQKHDVVAWAHAGQRA